MIKVVYGIKEKYNIKYEGDGLRLIKDDRFIKKWNNLIEGVIKERFCCNNNFNN